MSFRSNQLRKNIIPIILYIFFRQIQTTPFARIANEHMPLFSGMEENCCWGFLLQMLYSTTSRLWNLVENSHRTIANCVAQTRLAYLSYKSKLQMRYFAFDIHLKLLPLGMVNIACSIISQNTWNFLAKQLILYHSVPILLSDFFSLYNGMIPKRKAPLLLTVFQRIICFIAIFLLHRWQSGSYFLASSRRGQAWHGFLAHANACSRKI